MAVTSQLIDQKLQVDFVTSQFNARVMELADMLDLESSASACRCKSCLGYHYGLVPVSIGIEGL